MLSWGVLKKSDFSSQNFVRVCSLIGTAITRDARAIPVLLSHLRGPSAFLRVLAVKMASSYGDGPLCDELLRLLREEKVWYVRLEVIKAVGQLRLPSAKETLKEIIANPKTLAEEKSAALIGLASMYDTVEEAELKSLSTSNRAGLRQLACEVVSVLDLKEHVSFIIPLLSDTSADVRVSAITAMGLLRFEDKRINIEKLLNDTNASVSIAGAWLALIQKDSRGEDVFTRWIEDPNPEYRRLASAALAKTGVFGAKLAKKMLKKSPDPFVRVNLALGLIGVRKKVEEACLYICLSLLNEKETRLMWEHENHFLFKSLAPSKVGHIEQIANYPVVVDQLTRLELLSVLSVMQYPKALDAVKDFLKNTSWGVSGAAAVTLLREGDEHAFSAVKELLSDPDEKLRIQAALILSMVGNEPEAVGVLQEAYAHVEREMKIHILEALGHIGDPKSIPFLIEVLNEPFQVLRVVAASAIIQCLYH